MRRLMLFLMLFLAGPVLAGSDSAQTAAPEAQATARTPKPDISKGKGDSCVRPLEWMRRNHMKALMHQRDETMHEGKRGAEFSLKDCVSCHAVPGADGRAVAASDPKHFCRACHDYAAVKIDCFECHASRPDEPAKAAMPLSGLTANEVSALANYLEGNSP